MFLFARKGKGTVCNHRVIAKNPRTFNVLGVFLYFGREMLKSAGVGFSTDAAVGTDCKYYRISLRYGFL